MIYLASINSTSIKLFFVLKGSEFVLFDRHNEVRGELGLSDEIILDLFSL